ncbi:hypothetical protein IWZ01DRAFT_261717 [Phyllosticta capitalensis]
MSIFHLLLSTRQKFVGPSLPIVDSINPNHPFIHHVASPPPTTPSSIIHHPCVRPVLFFSSCVYMFLISKHTPRRRRRRRRLVCSVYLRFAPLPPPPPSFLFVPLFQKSWGLFWFFLLFLSQAACLHGEMDALWRLSVCLRTCMSATRGLVVWCRCRRRKSNKLTFVCVYLFACLPSPSFPSLSSSHPPPLPPSLRSSSSLSAFASKRDPKSDADGAN